MESQNSKNKIQTGHYSRKSLKIWSTNSDVFTKFKKQDLEARLHEQPDIIAISEVKPKSYSRTLSLVEYQIANYSLEPVLINTDVGRGIIVYIKRSIKYNVIDLSDIVDDPPVEVLALEIKLCRSDIFFICICVQKPQ